MTTTVVNIKHSPCDVYIGRSAPGKDGYFSNPYKLFDESERGEVIEKYRKYFYERLKVDSYFRQAVIALKGKRLGCYCFPQSCHGDVIAEYLNNLPAAGV